MQSLTASTPCKPRNGFAFRSSLSICESFVNYCNLLLQFTIVFPFLNENVNLTLEVSSGIYTCIFLTMTLAIKDKNVHLRFKIWILY